MTDLLKGVTIAFDLDGTLVHTAPDLTAAVNFVLEAQGLPPVDTRRIEADISRGAAEMLASAFRLAGADVPPLEVDRLYRDLYLPRYEATIADTSRPFDGLVTALDELQAQGALLAVCTNKWEALSRKLLTALSLDGRFAAIAGRDTFTAFKPDPRHLIETVRLAGGDPARAVMIGDSDTDVTTARRAGLPVVGVTFGYTSTPMVDLAPDVVIEHYRELLPALRRVLGRN
jgi:phosphoglycolate phosphatase